jgi:4-diphosphocytidyl-2-C-methyl-D-erythritol kinase
VLGRRADGYHEIRTVFQSISMADRVGIRYTPSREWSVTATPEIADNLAVKAAESLHRHCGLTGHVEIQITKSIPMGAGLGGGSSDAAAALLALPALAGLRVPLDKLRPIAAALGSDVPFFLDGGTSLGLGRGEELYPLPSAAAAYVAVVAPGVHVSTPLAYRALNRGLMADLTLAEQSFKLNSFRALVGELCGPGRGAAWREHSENDFECAVFREHPRLHELANALAKSGANPARMSGSGSALFGVFHTRRQMDRACRKLSGDGAEAVKFLSRREYRSRWLRALREHVDGEQWPPRSRHVSRRQM